MIDRLLERFVQLQGWLLEHIVQPPLLALGFGSHVEVAFDSIEFFLCGVLQISAAYLLLRPLEAWKPIEIWPDRKAVRVDVLYSLLDRLGIIPLCVFALLAPLFIAIDRWLRFQGFIPPQIEDLLPMLESRPLLGFLTYLVVLDLAEYWRHRLSHTWRWWWALHAIHHSQRQMTLWTDSRNHLLDDLSNGFWFAVVALFIGVPPGKFVGILIAVRTVENLSHVNARLSFGRLGEHLLVSPRYHRWHHALAQPAGNPFRYGCNFAVLFPIWDLLFGTQYMAQEMPATGIAAGPSVLAHAGSGYWRQQWEGLLGLLVALAPTAARLDATPPATTAPAKPAESRHGEQTEGNHA